MRVEDMFNSLTSGLGLGYGVNRGLGNSKKKGGGIAPSPHRVTSAEQHSRVEEQETPGGWLRPGGSSYSPLNLRPDTLVTRLV